MNKFRLKAPRYSLSALLLTVLLVGGVCAAWTNSAHRQQAAVRELRAAGMRITYAYKVEPDGKIDYDAKPPMLQAWFPGISIDYLSPVVNVGNASKHSTFSDEHIELLQRLPKLEAVHLHGETVTDDGLARLAQLSQLRNLGVSYNNQITDEGLRHLVHLQNLTRLDLHFTQLSDRCIPHLQRLPNLHYLNLDITRISSEGYMRLKDSLPNCTIKWKLRHDRPPISGAGPVFHLNSQQAPPITIDWIDLLRRKKEHGADRKFPLSAAEKGRILQLSDIVVNQEERDTTRKQAATELGQIGHVYCIPALLQTLRDEEQKETLRATCAFSLGLVADRRVVAPLIDVVDDGEVGLDASERLILLLPAGKQWDQAWNGDRSAAARSQIQAKWRSWWDENKETAELDYEAVASVE